MKPSDKAILGMISELPSRNESKPTGGLKENLDPEAELPRHRRRTLEACAEIGARLRLGIWRAHRGTLDWTISARANRRR